MIDASRRPYTAILDRAADRILMGLPMTVGDHLLHAWDALAAASRDDSKHAANVAFAERRVECIDELLATTTRITGARLTAARAELATLRDEIRSA